MHNVTRRRSPALVVALLALFVALTGTAAAAVIITSPDQLGDRVVTQRAIGFGAVSGSQLADGAVHGVAQWSTRPSAPASTGTAATRPSASTRSRPSGSSSASTR